MIGVDGFEELWCGGEGGFGRIAGLDGFENGGEGGCLEHVVADGSEDDIHGQLGESSLCF